MEVYIKKQCDKDDAARQKAIIDVINQFQLAKAKKERLRQRYAKCKDISAERQVVIDQFLSDEAKKDDAISDTLWGCVSKIQANISNKIHWSYEENKVVGSISQQLAQLGLGASTLFDAPRFIEQQQSPPFTGYEDKAVDEHGLTASQHYQMMCDEQALREFEAEQAGQQQEWDEKLRKEEAKRGAFIEEFPVYRSPSYDSACEEYSD